VIDHKTESLIGPDCSWRPPPEIDLLTCGSRFGFIQLDMSKVVGLLIGGFVAGGVVFAQLGGPLLSITLLPLLLWFYDAWTLYRKCIFIVCCFLGGLVYRYLAQTTANTKSGYSNDGGFSALLSFWEKFLYFAAVISTLTTLATEFL
jgi:hypothetical protein